MATTTRSKTGRLIAMAAAAVAVLLGSVQALADFTCRAEVNRTTVPRGEEVILTISAQGDVGWSPEFALPDLPGVQVYGGGTNQSMSVVNGRAETSVARTFYLRVDAKSGFTIGPVRITGNGDECSTEPITIRVTAPSGGVPPAHSGNRSARPVPDPSPQDVPGAVGKPGDEVFVTLDVDQSDVWVGQQVILTFRYWRRVQPWNNPSYKPPRSEGFWREDLGSERNYRRTWQGRAYNVTEINYALFPTRSGELTIEPAELTFPEDLFNRFFSSRSRRRGPRLLRTDPVTVTVRDLPSPAPATFCGIVASRLELRAAVDRDSVPRGEAVGLDLALDSDGFLKGFRALTLPDVAGARVHDASEKYSTSLDNGRLWGHVRVEKVVVADKEGVLRLPQVELVWFDTSRGAYRTTRTPTRDILVAPSDLPLTGQEGSGFLRSEIARLGEDLGFIHGIPDEFSRRRGPVVGSLPWALAILLPLILLGAFRIALERTAAQRRDPAGRRRRGALSAARAELSQARAAADTTERMSGYARAITGFVADRTDQPAAAVDAAAVMAYCGEAGHEEIGRELSDVLGRCDLARFGGGNADDASLDVAIGKHLARLARSGRRPAGRSPVSGKLLAVLGFVVAIQGAAGDIRADDRPGADPLRLAAEGNQAYTEGRIDDALGLYLAARDQGVNDPVLHFNLGNAFARSGQLGRAVASYLRAKRLAPRDDDIRQNLTWVRRHLKDLELADDALPLFIAQGAAVVEYFSLDEWGLFLATLVWVVALLVAWGWYRGIFGPGMRRLLIASVAVLLVAAATTAGRWYQEEVRDLGVVVASEATVRSGPADNFPVLFEVHDGLELNLEGRREGWVRVGLGGEWVGWLPDDAVESVRDGRRDPSSDQASPSGL